MDKYVKVHKNKDDIMVPFVIYNNTTSTWDYVCLAFGQEDVNFTYNDRPVTEFQKVLKRFTGKYLKLAFVWLLTNKNLETYGPSKSESEGGENSDDSSSSESSESSGSSGSSLSETEKKKEKAKEK